MRNIFKFIITKIKKCTKYHFHIICTRDEHNTSKDKCGPGSIIIFGVPVSIKYDKTDYKATLEVTRKTNKLSHRDHYIKYTYRSSHKEEKNETNCCPRYALWSRFKSQIFNIVCLHFTFILWNFCIVPMMNNISALHICAEIKEIKLCFTCWRLGILH